MAQFRPMLKRFDKEGYNAAKKIVDQKIAAFDVAVQWASKYVEIRNIEAFEADMVAEFKKDLLHKHEKNIGLPINADKLINLLDIPVYEFNRIATQYYEISVDVKVLDRKVIAEVDKSDYQLWTISEEENIRLRAARKFVEAVEELEQFTKVFPMNLTSGTSGMISYNMREQKYYPNV